MKSTIHTSASDRAIFIANGVSEFYRDGPTAKVEAEQEPTGNRHERRRAAKKNR